MGVGPRRTSRAGSEPYSSPEGPGGAGGTSRGLQVLRRKCGERTVRAPRTSAYSVTDTHGGVTVKGYWSYPDVPGQYIQLVCDLCVPVCVTSKGSEKCEGRVIQVLRVTIMYVVQSNPLIRSSSALCGDTGNHFNHKIVNFNIVGVYIICTPSIWRIQI